VTIGKGTAWGAPGPCPADAVVVRDTVGLFRLVNGERPGTPLLRGGDLGRTVGARPAAPSRPAEVQFLPIDLGRVTLDGRTLRFASHVVIRPPWRRGGWWRGPLLAVANAEFVGEWDVVPRGHPNDGWLDVVEVDPSFGVRERWAARSRVRHGMHVPHPRIRLGRVGPDGRHWDLTPGALCWVDSVAQGPVRSLDVVCIPDAATICV
jgi:hypothetical protein